MGCCPWGCKELNTTERLTRNLTPESLLCLYFFKILFGNNLKYRKFSGIKKVANRLYTLYPYSPGINISLFALSFAFS